MAISETPLCNFINNSQACQELCTKLPHSHSPSLSMEERERLIKHEAAQIHSKSRCLVESVSLCIDLNAQPCTRIWKSHHHTFFWMAHCHNLVLRINVHDLLLIVPQCLDVSQLFIWPPVHQSTQCFNVPHSLWIMCMRSPIISL